MRHFIPILIFSAGCKYNAPGLLTGDATTEDSSSDGMADANEAAVDAQACFGIAGWNVCSTPLPTTPLDLTAAIDTTSNGSPLCTTPTPASWTNGGQADACIVIATTITIANAVTIDVTGPRPLVLFATGDLTIDGTLDVAGHRVTDKRAPNSDPADCDPSTPGAQSNARAGGGGGASFGSIGGTGGKGDGGNANAGTAGAIDVAPHDKLRGGCRGATGTAGDDNAVAGAHGGGAVFLLAGGTLTVTGLVNASGAGATGGDNNNGGGAGGGSGGMIVLAAPTVTVATLGVLMANGGGGGGGADGNLGGNGSDPTDPAVQANGGPKGGGQSSAGGKGAAGSTAAAPGLQGNNGGGGGGGGGIGVIRVLQGALPTGQHVSPPATN